MLLVGRGAGWGARVNTIPPSWSLLPDRISLALVALRVHGQLIALRVHGPA